MNMLENLRLAAAIVERLPPRPQRIRFNSKHDMMHMLNEPDIRLAVPIDTLMGVPIVIDPEVPPQQYRIDW